MCQMSCSCDAFCVNRHQMPQKLDISFTLHFMIISTGDSMAGMEKKVGICMKLPGGGGGLPPSTKMTMTAW